MDKEFEKMEKSKMKSQMEQSGFSLFKMEESIPNHH